MTDPRSEAPDEGREALQLADKLEAAMQGGDYAKQITLNDFRRAVRLLRSSISSALPCEACPDPPSCAEYGNCRLSAAAPLHSSTPADMVLVPREIDRSKHGKVLLVWNDCMIEHETLEMTWPKLVAAIKEQRGGN